MDQLNYDKFDFEFDLYGYCLIPNVLSLDKVERMNELIVKYGLDKNVPKFLFVELDEIFYDLIFNPVTLQLASRWIDPHFRFDHCFGTHYPPDNGARNQVNLHGGPYQNQCYFQYNWYNNRPKCSSILFSYALQDQPEGSGGIVFLPGSHKLNYPITGKASEILEKFYGSRFPENNLPTLHRPVFKKGDLLAFSEATIHGTSQWKSKDNWRRHINYKYCYGPMGWLPTETELNMRLRDKAVTPLQKAVLEQPYASRLSGNQTEFRKPTLSYATSS